MADESLIDTLDRVGCEMWSVVIRLLPLAIALGIVGGTLWTLFRLVVVY